MDSLASAAAILPSSSLLSPPPILYTINSQEIFPSRVREVVQKTIPQWFEGPIIDITRLEGRKIHVMEMSGKIWGFFIYKIAPTYLDVEVFMPMPDKDFMVQKTVAFTLNEQMEKIARENNLLSIRAHICLGQNDIQTYLIREKHFDLEAKDKTFLLSRTLTELLVESQDSGDTDVDEPSAAAEIVIETAQN